MIRTGKEYFSRCFSPLVPPLIVLVWPSLLAESSLIAEQIHLVMDTRNSTGKGLGYVQFVKPDDAEKALLALDGKDFRGRLMHILPASDKKVQQLSEFELSKLPLKKQRAIKRKSDTSKASFS